MCNFWLTVILSHEPGICNTDPFWFPLLLLWGLQLVISLAFSRLPVFSPAALKIFSLSLVFWNVTTALSRVCFFLVIFLVNLLYFVYLWFYIFPENSQVLSVQILSTFWFLSSFLLELWFDMYSVILSSKTVNLSVIILYSSLCAILGYLFSFALQLFLFSAVSNLLFNQYIKFFF